MGRSGMMCGLIVAVAGALGASAQAQTALTTTRVASGLTQPLYVTHAPGDFSRLFIVERTGRVKILRNGAILPTPFIDVSSLIVTSWLEWGLLGMCFDPDYANNGYVYVHYSTGSGGDDNIVRFTRSTTDPDRVDPATRTTILFLAQPSINHRSGWMDFGADGYLYIPFGDGGPEGDTTNRAQNMLAMQGKINRIDVHSGDGFPSDPNKNYTIPPTNPFVSQPGVAPEIWAVGFRNPWRCSFDRVTHDLWIGDVGQSAWEEIDFQPASSHGGENYGWRCMEGNHCYAASAGCVCNAANLVRPVYEYSHTVGLSVTGGYVYRGCAIPDLVGTYFFADYQNSKLFSFRYVNNTVTEYQERTTQLRPSGGLSISNPASFGEDAYGELYICDYPGGEIFKIVPVTLPGPDCNHNGIADACELLDGSAADANHNGVPDVCDPPPCAADWNHSGSLDSQDFFDFVTAFFNFNADFNHDGTTTSQDFFDFVTAFFNGC